MDFWDKIASFYDIAESVNGKVYREMLDTVRGLIPQGARVLDVAAGTGQLSFAACENADEVICTDLSLPMLEKARKKAAKRGIYNISFEARNIFDLQDEDGTYDIVMAGNVLHLLENPQGAVQELCRVTKKGGLIILPTFMNDRRSVLIDLYKKLGFSPARNYDPISYRRMLEECGCGEVRAKLIRGMIPCCFAVIKKA